MQWVEETLKFLQEDKAEHYKVLMALIPLARTPMDKKSGQSMAEHAKKVTRMLEAMTPWIMGSSRKDRLKRKLQPGETVVILEAGDNKDHPLYKDAKLVRE